MYPNLYYFFKDVLNVEWSFLRLFNTFGLFVAIAFIVASWIMGIELKRKQQLGLFVHTDKKIISGKPASFSDLLINFILGFIFGYKIIGALVVPHALDNPQAFLLSGDGHMFFGLLLGSITAGYKYYELNKTKLEKPEERTVRIWPQDRVGDIVLLAAVFGFLGAKIFHNLENWNDFIQDPIGSLISFSGLTFYGGLICATLAIAVYAKKHKIPFLHLADATAPALMIAYAIGRIGCQVAGDGDWGIINSAFITDASGHVITATTEQFNAALQQHHGFYINIFGSLDQVHHINVQPVSWLPNWLFGYTYPHNVINEGVPLANCSGEYCNALPLAVFPTPFYETIASTVFFFVLMKMRKHIKTAGTIFGIYLMMNGFERFWVEKIRVNTVYQFGNFHPTQAEIISTILFLTGLALYFLSKRKSVIA
ncbi:MAG: prolipoprotein diacylglyceryl transferase [Chitinophagaceae bacterium]|nr:prolipoprotein diacylglyceryl transferase [Chitinophagaceae bacterium]